MLVFNALPQDQRAMKIIKTRLETLTIVFGPKLYKFPRRVLSGDMPLLPPDLDPVLFARHHPPLFHQLGDNHILEARHLSFLINLLSEPDREVAIGLLDPGEVTDWNLEQLAAQDQHQYAGLAAESQKRGPCQPTKTKAKYLGKGQICPLCFLDGPRVKLAAPQPWRRLLKQNRGAPLHCTRCSLHVKVTTDELRRFTKADLPTAGWLEVQRDGERPAACARCAAKGRSGIILIRITANGERHQYCSNALRAKPSCTFAVALKREDAWTPLQPWTSSLDGQLPLPIN